MSGAVTRSASKRPAGEGALLGEAEVQRLLLAASPRAPTGVRNRALIALLYCSGLRLAEALGLRTDDCDLGSATLAVRGARKRTAHLFPAAAPYLESWLALRATLALPARAPLFPTLAGEPLEPAYVRAMLARLAKRAGLGKRVHAHLFRHSCAARLARSGVGAEAVAEQLGHSQGRGSARSLGRFGVALSARGLAHAADVRWSLAPEPGAVRAVLVGGRGPRPAKQEPRASGVVVRRWQPEEL